MRYTTPELHSDEQLAGTESHCRLYGLASYRIEVETGDLPRMRYVNTKPSGRIESARWVEVAEPPTIIQPMLEPVA